MAEAKRIDGRHLTTGEFPRILSKLGDELPGLAGKLDASKIPGWQERSKPWLMMCRSLWRSCF